VMWYVILPEKGIAGAFVNGLKEKLSLSGDLSACGAYFWLYIAHLFTPLLDMCGIAALLVAIATNNTPLPLIVGYSLTAAAPIFSCLGWAVYLEPGAGPDVHCGMKGWGLALVRSSVLVILYLLLVWGMVIDGLVTTAGIAILGVTGLLLVVAVLWLFLGDTPYLAEGDTPYLAETVKELV